MNVATKAAVLYTEKDVSEAVKVPLDLLPSYAAFAQWENAADISNKNMLWDALKKWEDTLTLKDGEARKTDFKSNESVMYVMADLLKAFGSLEQSLQFLIDSCHLIKWVKEEILKLAARIAAPYTATGASKDLKLVEQGAACEGK